MKSVTTYY